MASLDESSFGIFPLILAGIFILIGLIVMYRHRDHHKDDHSAPH